MKKINFLACLFAITLFVACGGDHSHGEGGEHDHAHEHSGETHGHDHAHEGDGHTHSHGEESAVKLTDFSASPEFEDAALTKMTYENGQFDFDYTGTDYKLGEQTSDAEVKMCANSAKGQHIHLIVDNQPYAAKYVSEFEHEVADGEHYILAFLSRSYHESIKNGTASMVKKVNVANKSVGEAMDVSEPMLFYSRPKGTYVGEKATTKVMLDFFLHNVTLGDDYQVKVEANGAEVATVKEWKPYFLEGLPMGDNKVKLTLVDGEGKAVATPLNPVERVFTLKEDPAQEG